VFYLVDGDEMGLDEGVGEEFVFGIDLKLLGGEDVGDEFGV
jgi:hypothetical protein